jgi:exopolysaccharide production protein ExoQ
MLKALRSPAPESMPSRLQNWLEPFEKIFTFATLLYCTGALNAMMFGGLAIEVNVLNLNVPEVKSGPASGAVFLIIQNGIFLVTLGLLALRWPRYLKLMTKPRLIWLYTLLVLASCLWTNDAIMTLRRSLLLLATTLFGFYMAGRFTIRQQMLLLASALSFSGFMHLTFGILFPAYAQHVMYFAGAWRGLMTHKNSLAQLSVFSVMMLQLVLPFQYRHRPWLWAALVVNVLLVFLSTSKTGLALMILLSLLLPLLRSLRAKRLETQLAVMTGFLTIATAAIAIVTNLEPILAAMGRNATLTGRTGLWEVLLYKISLRPWLGYGYRAFWEGGMDGEAVDVWYSQNFIVATAHNGFLEILLEVGLVGLVLFLLGAVFNVKRGFYWLLHTRSPEGLYPLALLTFWLLYNFTESTTPQVYSLAWIAYVSMSTSMLIYRLPSGATIGHNRLHETLSTPADPRVPRAPDRTAT